MGIAVFDIKALPLMFPGQLRGAMMAVALLSGMPKETFFQCQRCGNCCKWPGEVVVTDAEIDSISAYLNLPVLEFIERYAKVRANRQGLTLIEKPNHECVFLDGIDCTINDVKPSQCSGFPNTWNFPGWRKVCEAVPVELDTHS